MIKLIVCVDQGNAIGWSDGRLAVPGLKHDMQRFKDLTTGQTVVMGFNTYKSLNRPDGLPNRRNIVLTRRPWSEIRGQIGETVEVVSSLDWVVRFAANNLRVSEPGNPPAGPIVWLIGGRTVYDEAIRLGVVDEIYLTVVHTDTEADVRLVTDLAAWKLFVLNERHRGIHWEPTLGTTQWDGDFQTTYLHFTKK